MNFEKSSSVEKIIELFSEQAKKIDLVFNSGTSFDKDALIALWQQRQDWTDGIFAQCDWRILGCTSYGQALYKAYARIEELQLISFVGSSKDFFQEQSIVQTFEAKQQWATTIAKKRDYNLFGIAAQCGRHHLGYSPRLANEVSFLAGQYYCSVWNMVLIMITHPEYLMSNDATVIYCCGDRHENTVEYVPYFERIDDSILYYYCHVGNVHTKAGAATFSV